MIPTDTDTHRERDAAGRDAPVKRVREKIDALGVDYIYCQTISITGRVMGKAAPSRHRETQARKGVQTWMGGVADVAANFSGELIGFDSNAMECVAPPDPETFIQIAADIAAHFAPERRVGKSAIRAWWTRNRASTR